MAAQNISGTGQTDSATTAAAVRTPAGLVGTARSDAGSSAVAVRRPAAVSGTGQTDARARRLNLPGTYATLDPDPGQPEGGFALS